MKFSTISNERLSDKIISQIMDNIKSGELKPGTRLPSEPELAFNLGVSRGILREALNILRTEGIICRKPKEGTFIAPNVMEIISGSWEVSIKEATYLDLIEVRECFEPKVVEKIIELASDEEIENLVNILENGVDSDEAHSLDYYFHYKLAELSRNVVFVNFIDTYFDIIDEVKVITSKKEKRLSQIHEEHKKIVEAIRERDVQKAKAQMRYHLQKVKENALSSEEKFRKEKSAEAD